MLPRGCEPCYEGGYGDDGTQSRYSMDWCPLHANAAATAVALRTVAGVLQRGVRIFEEAYSGPEGTPYVPSPEELRWYNAARDALALDAAKEAMKDG